MIEKLNAFCGKAAKSIQFFVFLLLLSRTWGEKEAGRMRGACFLEKPCETGGPEWKIATL
jgi:hypothetical protein